MQVLDSKNKGACHFFVEFISGAQIICPKMVYQRQNQPKIPHAKAKNYNT